MNTAVVMHKKWAISDIKVTKENVLYCVVAAALIMFAFDTFALTAPVAGDPGFEIYDLLVNDVIKGAIGMTGSVALIALGVINISQNWIKGVVTGVAGGLLFNADAVSTSFGMMLPF